ncbi:unnamed protein product [Cutaneotrichosporon oleaginosum]
MTMEFRPKREARFPRRRSSAVSYESYVASYSIRGPSGGRDAGAAASDHSSGIVDRESTRAPLSVVLPRNHQCMCLRMQSVDQKGQKMTPGRGGGRGGCLVPALPEPSPSRSPPPASVSPFRPAHASRPATGQQAASPILDVHAVSASGKNPSRHTLRNLLEATDDRSSDVLQGPLSLPPQLTNSLTLFLLRARDFSTSPDDQRIRTPLPTLQGQEISPFSPLLPLALAGLPSFNALLYTRRSAPHDPAPSSSRQPTSPRQSSKATSDAKRRPARPARPARPDSKCTTSPAPSSFHSSASV